MVMRIAGVDEGELLLGPLKPNRTDLLSESQVAQLMRASYYLARAGEGLRAKRKECLRNLRH
jgi:hypothetical protein